MILAGTRINVVRQHAVWHIGSMRPEDKGSNGPSLEGRGLSVSTEPDAWEHIARLGGLPRWRLERQGAAFLDFHGLENLQRQFITNWAISNGWLSPQERWEVSYNDTELVERCTLLFTSEGEARGEYVEKQECGDGVSLEPVIVSCPTERMNRRLGFIAPDINGIDLAVTFWVEDETGLDGVWWEDRLEPENYSAPRGVIVPRAIAGWGVQLEPAVEFEPCR